jgi:hypothetical protein
MDNEPAPETDSEPSSPTLITGTPSASSSVASSPGPSPLCWAANLSAALTQCATLYWLGIPLLATFIEALKTTPRDRWTMVVSGVAFLAVARPKVLMALVTDAPKVLTAVKGILPGQR